ncbi:MAG: hypothetical protein FJ313_07860, partial [Gemmatimonadetes bacterium]|nr:hypothetical protein [Gemmatimonadota bacterium]
AGVMVLSFRSKALQENFEEELRDPRIRRAVESAVRDAYGADLELRFENSRSHSAGLNNTAATDSPLVRSALAMGARIIETEERPRA